MENQKIKNNWFSQNPVITVILGIIGFVLIVNIFSSSPKNDNKTPLQPEVINNSNQDTQLVSTTTKKLSDDIQKLQKELDSQKKAFEKVINKPAVQQITVATSTEAKKNQSTQTQQQIQSQSISVISPVQTISTQTENQNTSPVSNGTVSQQNALRAAQSYLNYAAFSHDGLAAQLVHDQFSQSDAGYGADNVGADWNAQAIKAAKSYLNYAAFSHDGLAAQLVHDKFTQFQAVYGADNSGANWNEQAAKKAKSYMEYSAFSRGRLIEQLEYEKFTQAQAEYGADSVGL